MDNIPRCRIQIALKPSLLLFLSLGTLIKSQQDVQTVLEWGVDSGVNYPAGKYNLSSVTPIFPSLETRAPLLQPTHSTPLRPGSARATAPFIPPNADELTFNVESPCQCSDADPKNEATQEVEFTCFAQRVFGNCQEIWMFEANAELNPEGQCQISCSRCNCCKAPSEVLRELGATQFLSAIQTAGLAPLFDHPGFTATILVPSNTAMQMAATQLDPLSNNPAVLAEIVKFHILTLDPEYQALLTTPFFPGATLYTQYSGPEVLEADDFVVPADITWKGGLTGFKINGPLNAAAVLQSDILGCKAYFNVIDTVLLPFAAGSGGEGGRETAVAGALVGAPQCNVRGNSLVSGDVVVPGTNNIVENIGECCDQCATNPRCNAFVFCSNKAGCEGLAITTSRPFGYCELIRSGNGNGPWFAQTDAVMSTLVSGWTSSSATVSAQGN